MYSKFKQFFHCTVQVLCRCSLTELFVLGFLEVFTLEYSLYLAEKSWANMGEVGVEALECLKLP